MLCDREGQPDMIWNLRKLIQENNRDNAVDDAIASPLVCNAYCANAQFRRDFAVVQVQSSGVLIHRNKYMGPITSRVWDCNWRIKDPTIDNNTIGKINEETKMPQCKRIYIIPCCHLVKLKYCIARKLRRRTEKHKTRHFLSFIVCLSLLRIFSLFPYICICLRTKNNKVLCEWAWTSFIKMKNQIAASMATIWWLVWAQS